MKKLTILSTVLMLSLLAICSCVKSGKVGSVDDVPFDYHITFSDQVHLPGQGGDRELTFTISNLSRTRAEEVEVWLEGIPDNVETSIEPQKVKPTANVTLTFRHNYARPGHYTAVLHTKSSSGIKKEYPFTFTVMERLCIDNFSGFYEGPTNCMQGSSGTGMLDFTKQPAEKNRLLFWWGGLRSAIVNCHERTMTFVEQQLGDSTFSGHATYSEDFKTVTMTYNIKRANGDNYSCTTTYIRR